jgi:asparagine synthase (glutamine-hydrolysing)
VTDVPPGSSLTPLEIASGLVFGVEHHREEPDGGAPVSARAALDAAVLPALRRPPCLVSFSGGLDSSAILAVSASVAQREGLPPPVPVTLRFPGNAEAEESPWQETVVAAVPVDDWVRLEFEEELSVVGPIARSVLLRHGLLWPFNSYVHAPMLERARGGSLLTGFGGDELLARSRWDRIAAIARGARLRRRDLYRGALAIAPPRLRAAALRSRCPLDLPWLSEAARRELARSWAAEAGSEPVLSVRRGRWRLRLRSLSTAQESLASIAAAHGAGIVHPLADPAVVDAVSRVRDARWSRGEMFHAILGDILPSELYARSTKASFNTAFWGNDARDLARTWGGEGVDEELIDVEAVRAAWAAPVPDGRTFTLLQSAWLTLDLRGPEATSTRDERSPRASQATADAGSRRPVTPQGGGAPTDRSAGA